jgi:hypothetical protein
MKTEKKKQNNKKMEKSCVHHLIPKIKEQTKRKKKDIILENFQYR